jgi:hypothetical protein
MIGLKQLILTVDVDEVSEDCHWWGKEGMKSSGYTQTSPTCHLEKMWCRR